LQDALKGGKKEAVSLEEKKKKQEKEEQGIINPGETVYF